MSSAAQHENAEYLPREHQGFRPWVSLVAFFTVAATWGCAGSPPPDPVVPVQTSDGPAVEVSPSAFAGETHALLLSTDRDQKSKLRLAGVVQYQLSRAEQLFRDGFTPQAEDVVTGALLLLRHDDELLSATRGQQVALFEAAHAAARAGDAGRAEALYTLTLQVATNPSIRDDAKQHLEALADFNESTQGSSELERVGEQTRRALARAVVDPKAEAYLAARDNVILWMQAALASPAGESQPTTRAERELALEAYRAIRTGAPALVTLGLRQGSPGAALTALENAKLERALPSGFYTLINEAQRKNNPDAWLELFRQMEGIREEEGGSETQLPRYVTDGASFWAAIQLYRASPGVMEHAMPLAMILVEFGMPEVASSLLSQNASADTKGQALAWSLSLVLRGLLELSQTEQLMAARRSYQEAERLFRLADAQPGRGPGSAEAESLMAALETRHGFVERALPLMESSARHVQTPEILLRLAQLQMQQGMLDKAKRTIMRAVELAQKSGDLLVEAQAEEALFRAHRASGDRSRAGAALSRAMSRTLVLRQMEVSTVEKATVERQLARLLEYYGRKREMRQAYFRALEASRSSLAELEITLTDMSRAALTAGDVKLGRRATQSALEVGLPPENSIYIALWQQLLERRTGSRADGISREVLMRAGKAEGWLDVLRRFGLGEIQPHELEKMAEGIPQKAEANFYEVLSQPTPPPSKERLLSIADSPAVDLIEVRIAQDLMAAEEPYELPADVVLP